MMFSPCLLSKYAALFIVAFSCLLAQVSLAQETSKPQKYTELPREREYWEFERWYSNHSAVDVIVNGSSPDHLIAILKQLQRLKRQKVLIRDIIVIGGNSYSQLDKQARSRIRRSLKQSELNTAFNELGISPVVGDLAEDLAIGHGSSMPSAENLIATLRVETSPVWLVTAKGKQHIFEGTPSISKYFSANGQFDAALNMQAAVNRPEAPDVASHSKGSSRVPILPVRENSASASSYIKVFKYQFEDLAQIPGTGTSDFKPDCAARAVRRVPVLYYTEELDTYDFTFYNHRNNDQRTAAKKQSRVTSPYLEGDLHNPWRRKPDILQEFARFFDIRCLPTRLHFVLENGRHFEEYREGDDAWE